jgi:hypothetical protein
MREASISVIIGTECLKVIEIDVGREEISLEIYYPLVDLTQLGVIGMMKLDSLLTQDARN